VPDHGMREFEFGVRIRVTGQAFSQFDYLHVRQQLESLGKDAASMIGDHFLGQITSADTHVTIEEHVPVAPVERLP